MMKKDTMMMRVSNSNDSFSYFLIKLLLLIYRIFKEGSEQHMKKRIGSGPSFFSRFVLVLNSPSQINKQISVKRTL